jgi:hypothetical protein
MVRTSSLFLLFLLVSILFPGCYSPVETISFTAHEASYPLQQRPKTVPEMEGRLLHSSGGFSTARYYLPEDAENITHGSFMLEYQGEGETLVLEMGRSGKSSDIVTLPLPPAPGGAVENNVILLADKNLSFRWFRIRSEKPSSSFRLRSAGFLRKGETLDRLVLSFADNPGGVRATYFLSPSYGVDALKAVSDQKAYLAADLELGVSHDPLYRTTLNLGYRHASGDSPVRSELRIVDTESGDIERYHLTLRPGERQMSILPKRDLSGSLRIELESDSFDGFTHIAFTREPAFPDERYIPLNADLGEVLSRSEVPLRFRNFELYRWNLLPGILVFDFASYAYQAKMLKRLAFFVEKRGSVGTILPFEAVENRHGWNAHDYRSEDLARFFTLAEQEKVTLNPEELLLRDILLQNGTIVQQGTGRWSGENGGIISISRESSPRLRRLFLVHEGYHGIFFVSEPFREEVFALWNDLSEDEKRFWRRFLDWRTYSVEDTYLLVNEFTAYLMQQSTGRSDAYFHDFIIPGLIKARPQFTAEIEQFVLEYPDHFSRSAMALEEIATRTLGVTAGDLLDSRFITER